MKLLIAKILLTLQCVVLLVWPLPEILTGHIFLEDWPPHARFHAIWAAGMLVALCAMTLTFTWRYLKQGETAAWFAIASFVFFAQGSVLVARLYYPGPDWIFVFLGIAAPTLALVLSAPTAFSKADS